MKETATSSTPAETIAGRKKIWFLHSLIPVYWKPILLLLILTPILTELLTNNIPVTRFFRLKLFFLLAVLVYGPVLLLRELAVRWNLSMAGYIILGLVYGTYNEGLLGKTIFKVTIANTAFDNYGIVWGINLSWAMVIIVFHAFYAFLFPLLIVYTAFPKAASATWINKRWWLIISTAFFLYVSYIFLKNAWPAKPIHYVLLVALMAALVFLSALFKGGLLTTDKKHRLWLLSCYGIIFVASTFTLADIIARSHAHILFFLTYAMINLLAAMWLLSRKYSIRSLLYFVFAAQLGFALSAIYVAVVMKAEKNIITSSLFAAVFAAALLFTMRKNKNRN